MVLLGPTPQRYQLATGFVATNKPGKICICDICRNQVLESLGIWEAPTPHRTVTYYPNSTIAKTFYSWVESWWLTSIVAQKIHSVAHLNQYRKYSYNIIYIHKHIIYHIIYFWLCVQIQMVQLKMWVSMSPSVVHTIFRSQCAKMFFFPQLLHHPITTNSVQCDTKKNSSSDCGSVGSCNSEKICHMIYGSSTGCWQHNQSTNIKYLATVLKHVSSKFATWLFSHQKEYSHNVPLNIQILSSSMNLKLLSINHCFHKQLKSLTYVTYVKYKNHTIIGRCRTSILQKAQKSVGSSHTSALYLVWIETTNHKLWTNKI